MAPERRNSLADPRPHPLGAVRRLQVANVPAALKSPSIDPATEQVWEALRALYLVGQMDDLPAIRPYERDLPDISNDVRQQAVETEKAIRKREK